MLTRPRFTSFVFATLTAAFTLTQAHAQAPLTRDQLLAEMTPQMAEVVLLFDAIKGTPIINLTPADARQQFSLEDTAKILERGAGKAEQPLSVGNVRDGLTVPGTDGNQIPIRIYTPKGTGPFPVVVYFHGGGFVVATIDTYDASARTLAANTPAIVVSVEYRKAPEAPFPAAYNDAISAYKWTLSNIATYNGNPGKVAVAGESAGGNLATEVALAARDQNLQLPTTQILIYPVASSNTNQLSDLLYTNSSLPLATPALPYFLNNYLSNTGVSSNDPRVAPINANLKGLPSATIISAQIDPLASDGLAYYTALQTANHNATYRLFPGVTHEFFGLGAYIPTALTAEQFASAQLAASFK
ncbi:MAG: alpha/beta hydrolase [Janthinobacterium lividum]